ncbi:MAG: Rrf2 family transcriptional regulator [Clostridiales bacterium]|jgi:Rrf2 family protein|nr:Rrf2 family transcriptional regulator [Clostridiales bacterium]
MKISTRGRYGLRALLDLAMHADQGCVALSDIAHRQDLSFNYLEGIFAHLKRAGLVIGIAGSMGGYTLAKPSETISLYEILSVLEGDLSVTDPVMQNEESDIRTFIRQNVWDVLDHSIESTLKNTTVAGLTKSFQFQEDSNQCSCL